MTAARNGTGGPRDDPSQPPGVLLAALRRAWDGIYLITRAGDGLMVIRAGDGESFRAAGPLEARDEILADYARKPARSRDSTGALARRLAFERAHPGVSWTAPSAMHRAAWEQDGERHEEASPTVDGLLALLAARGLS